MPDLKKLNKARNIALRKALGERGFEEMLAGPSGEGWVQEGGRSDGDILWLRYFVPNVLRKRKRTQRRGKVLMLSKAGMAPSELAAVLGCSMRTIQRDLAALANEDLEPVRTERQKRLLARDKVILDLVEEKHPVAVIADLLGLSRARVYQILKSYQVKGDVNV